MPWGQNHLLVEPALLRLGQRDEILGVLGCEVQILPRVLIVGDADGEHVERQLGFGPRTGPFHLDRRRYARAIRVVRDHRDLRILARDL